MSKLPALIDEILRLEAKATPGPWQMSHQGAIGRTFYGVHMHATSNNNGNDVLAVIAMRNHIKQMALALKDFYSITCQCEIDRNFTKAVPACSLCLSKEKWAQIFDGGK